LKQREDHTSIPVRLQVKAGPGGAPAEPPAPVSQAKIPAYLLPRSTHPSHAERRTMTDRAHTLLEARRERLERLLGRPMERPVKEGEALTQEARAYLLGEAENLYWNDLEWEHITDEEALEEGPITQLAFPGFLAFVRGLLLHEVMPDSIAPASPRPEVVEEILAFLARRVVELEDGLAESKDDEVDKLRSELEMTSQLIDLVLHQFHGLRSEELERIEARGPASA